MAGSNQVLNGGQVIIDYLIRVVEVITALSLWGQGRCRRRASGPTTAQAAGEG